MLVHKYGGSSVATTNQIMDIAKHLKNIIDKENRKIIVVVSAMGKTTNSLIEKANEITSKPVKREMDALLSTGECVSAPLLSIALNSIKVKTLSLNGLQAGIKTSGDYSKSYINSINTKKLKTLLKTYDVIVITGFQGVNAIGDITTLGRGGSDTTAVALACALKCPCEIYTDVEHIYTFDPRIIPNAKPIENLSYEEMIELALGGAKVLEPRSVELAKKYNIPIYLGKSLETKKRGSFVMKKSLESEKVSSLAIKENVSVLTIKADIKDKNFLSNLLNTCKQELSSYTLLSYLTIGTNQLVSISLDSLESKNLIKNLESSKILSSSASIEIENLSKIVVVGVGFVTHPKLTNEVISLLTSKSIVIKNLNVNEFSLNITVEKTDALNAISIVCENFKL